MDKRKFFMDFLNQIINSVLSNFDGIKIYDKKITKYRNDYVIKIELDNLKNPYGSVDLNICEKFSKLFIKELDEVLTNFDLRYRLKKEYENFPDDLNLDNYSLEVSSAGAERQIKLPDDLERFKNLPMKVIYSYTDESKKNKTRQIIVKYIESNDDEIFFEGYESKKGIKNKSKKEKFVIKLSDIKKVYLSPF